MTKALSIIITIVITALFTGGGVYYWQNSRNTQESQAQNNKIQSLENTISNLEKNAINPEDIEAEIIAPECPDYNLPALSFGRAGLLTETEKTILEEKLINPFIDYYKDMPEELISMDIMVPANPGEKYKITAIFQYENFTPRQEFIFGAREADYDYWAPECMNECEFSEAFRAKYPQIVE